MIWFVLFVIWALVAFPAFVIWLALSVVQGVLTCAEKVLANLANGHVQAALLYLIPTGLFLSGMIKLACLAFSFYWEVAR